MTGTRVCITGIGLISPPAWGVPGTRTALKQGEKGLGPVTLFQVPQESMLPVGQVQGPVGDARVPRTHRLALMAAKEALGETPPPLDAVVIGGTTGGMFDTEERFKAPPSKRRDYRYHAPGSVADYLAQTLGCSGPVMTVSTACSSGAVAIKTGLALLRARQAHRVLAGGVDTLCRLTYFGFKSLQLMDPDGARPLDQDRRGMTLSEGAGMLLLEAKPARSDPAACDIEVLGAGLSCDAYHPSAPDPEGKGALMAITAALHDAGVQPADIDYIQLHGTGTEDNDLSEARAVTTLFKDRIPPSASVKGAMGHSLAASGAIEAGIAALSIQDGLIPGTIGCRHPDPRLGLDPVKAPTLAAVDTVLTNAFGFGGNNAALVLGRSRESARPEGQTGGPFLRVTGSACITGAGDMAKTLHAVSAHGDCQGVFPEAEFSLDVPPRSMRRFKRLPRMALALGMAAHQDAGEAKKPGGVFLGTGWGPLSETYDFLMRVTSSEEQFCSPTGFVESVYNAPAGHIARYFKATGPNITVTNGDYSFEQALMTAALLTRQADEPVLVLGADEFHETLSMLFDDAVAHRARPADGGGALCVRPSPPPEGVRIGTTCFQNARHTPEGMDALIRKLGGGAGIASAYGALLAGIPAVYEDLGRSQLHTFCSAARFQGPVIPYRQFTGEFASASAVAAALGVVFVDTGKIPEGLAQTGEYGLKGKGILMLGLGRCITAVEIHPGG